MSNKQSERALKILNDLVRNPSNSVLLLSSMDPVSFLFEPLLYSSEVSSDLKLCKAWVNALVSFDFVVSEELLHSVQSGTTEESYFVWTNCSNREKLALWQLTRFGLVNRSNRRAIEQLIKKSLVCYSSETGRITVAPRLNELILKSEMIEKEVMLLLESRVDTAWQGLKGALGVTAVAGLLFFAIRVTEFSSWGELIVTLVSLGGTTVVGRALGQLASVVRRRDAAQEV